MTMPRRPTGDQLVALGEYLDHKYPPTVLTVLDAFRTVLERDDHPHLDSITAITASDHGPTVTAHVCSYLAFLQWARHFGLAFQRTYQRGGFVLSARGPINAGHLELQVHLLCDPDGTPE
jgi:hypothetical protein